MHGCFIGCFFSRGKPTEVFFSLDSGLSNLNHCCIRQRSNLTPYCLIIFGLSTVLCSSKIWHSTVYTVTRVDFQSHLSPSRFDSVLQHASESHVYLLHSAAAEIYDFSLLNAAGRFLLIIIDPHYIYISDREILLSAAFCSGKILLETAESFSKSKIISIEPNQTNLELFVKKSKIAILATLSL